MGGDRSGALAPAAVVLHPALGSPPEDSPWRLGRAAPPEESNAPADVRTVGASQPGTQTVAPDWYLPAAPRKAQGCHSRPSFRPDRIRWRPGQRRHRTLAGPEFKPGRPASSMVRAGDLRAPWHVELIVEVGDESTGTGTLSDVTVRDRCRRRSVGRGRQPGSIQDVHLTPRWEGRPFKSGGLPGGRPPLLPRGSRGHDRRRQVAQTPGQLRHPELEAAPAQATPSIGEGFCLW
jgi:hypothetical protein